MNDQDDLAARAKEELSGMAKQGMAHPSKIGRASCRERV